MSSQSKEPPPPPPLLGAVTLSDADALAALLPAGPVDSACAAIVLV
jgi:hypothetical protein